MQRTVPIRRESSVPHRQQEKSVPGEEMAVDGFIAFGLCPVDRGRAELLLKKLYDRAVDGLIEDLLSCQLVRMLGGLGLEGVTGSGDQIAAVVQQAVGPQLRGQRRKGEEHGCIGLCGEHLV